MLWPHEYDSVSKGRLAESGPVTLDHSGRQDGGGVSWELGDVLSYPEKHVSCLQTNYICEICDSRCQFLKCLKVL